MSSPFIIPPILNHAIWYSVLAGAMVRGSREMRWIAGATLADFLLCRFLLEWGLIPHQHGGIRSLALLRIEAADTTLIDVLAFVPVIHVAIRSDRLWPLLYASVWLVTVLIDLTEIGMPVGYWAWGTADLAANYVMIFIILFAADRACRTDRAPPTTGAALDLAARAR